MKSPDGSTRVLIPLSSTDGLKPFLNFGRLVFQDYDEIVMLGVVVASDDAGRDAERARTMRRRLRQLVRDSGLSNARVVVRSALSLAQGVRAAVLEEQPGLAVVPWRGWHQAGDGFDELASRPPCDTAFVRYDGDSRGSRVLLAARGGPQAELAMELALNLSRAAGGELTLMHIDRPSAGEQDRRGEHRLFQSLLARCRRETRVKQRTITTDDVAASILGEAEHHDVLVLGAGMTRPGEPALGNVAETVTREAGCTSVVVKTGTPMDPAFFSGNRTPIDVVVDRWFADNTFHCREFADLEALVAAKRRAGLSVSLAIMAGPNREALPGIVETVGAELQERNALLDEMVVFDQAGNTLEPPFDPTAGTEDAGAPAGAGAAIWQTLHKLGGDIVAWIDGDLRNIHPRMVYGVVGPLLTQERLQYVKGFYQRPATSDDASFSQGRTQLTELTARPLLNLFFPELSGVIEPLGREHAIRREALNAIRLFAGQGADIGLLLDMYARFGLRAIAQSNLESRVGEDLSVSALTEQAFSIIQVILKRLPGPQAPEASSRQQGVRLILQRDERYRLEVIEAAERELPPISRDVDVSAIG